MAQKFKMSGILRGVEITSGQKQNGTEWERASLKIEKKDGVTKKVSTFDTNDIEAANKANGKEIEVLYTKSKDDQYNNLENGSIKVLGQGEAPVTDSEEVKEEEAIEEKENADQKYNVKQIGTKDNYWQNKFEFEKQTHYEKQTSIIRQNSWTQAMKYLESCLKAVELDLIVKKDFSSKEMTIEKMKEFAHQIETDIIRKNGTK